MEHINQHTWTDRLKGRLPKLGRIVRVLECAHIDVRHGTYGIVDRVVKGGYHVKVTTLFADDFHGYVKSLRSETVFVEKKHVEFV